MSPPGVIPSVALQPVAPTLPAEPYGLKLLTWAGSKDRTRATPRGTSTAYAVPAEPGSAALRSNAVAPSVTSAVPATVGIGLPSSPVVSRLTPPTGYISDRSYAMTLNGDGSGIGAPHLPTVETHDRPTVYSTNNCGAAH